MYPGDTNYKLIYLGTNPLLTVLKFFILHQIMGKDCDVKKNGTQRILHENKPQYV